MYEKKVPLFFLLLFKGFVTTLKKKDLTDLEIVVLESLIIKKEDRPNVLKNTSLITAISVCCQLIGAEMLTLFDFPQFSQGWHIVRIPPDAPAECFSQKNESPGFFLLKCYQQLLWSREALSFFFPIFFCFLVLLCFSVVLFWMKKQAAEVMK